MATIKLICFDLDDTLWSTKQVMLEAEKHCYAMLQESAPALCEHYDLKALFAARIEKWKILIAKQPELQHQVSQLRQQSLGLLLQDHGFSQDEARHLSAQVFECFMHWRHQPVYFEHALETLATLKQNYALAAITNGNACSERLGLDQYFSLHVSAEALGIGKPEAEPFLHTLKHFQLDANECLHIGDNPEDDIRGAQQAGMHSLWFNRKQETWPHKEYQASLEVDALEKIPAAVQQLQDTLSR